MMTAIPSWAQEGSLLIPMDFESAKVLPRGIRNFRLRGAQFQATDSYNGSGQVVPTGNALNKGVTWNKIIDGKSSDLEKGLLKGYLQSKNVDLNQEVGQTTGVVGVDFQTTVPIFAYGVTEKMTIAMAVPVVRHSLQVDSGFVSNDNLKNVGNILNGDGSQNKAYELRYKTAQAIQEKLKDYNYDALQDDSQTRLGDIRLVGKNLLLRQGRVDMALKTMVTVPTGTPTRVNRAVDIGSGDGQWDVGMGVISDVQVTKNNLLTGYVAGIAQLPTHRERRIPKEHDSKLSPDVDGDTKMDLGDMLQLQLGNKYSFLKGFSFSSAMSVQYKGRDKYSGDKYDGYRYNWLSKDTSQSMQTMQLALGYSTIELFREGKFAAPLETNLTFNRVIAGQNVIADYLVCFELAAYF